MRGSAMSLTDLIQSRDDADAVGQAMLLAQVLMDGPPESGPRTFCYTSPKPVENANNRSEPFGAGFGVRGVGVVSVKGRLYPGVLKYVPDIAAQSAPPKPLH